MWIFTPIGFFSIVQKKDDLPGTDGTLTVRSRIKGDLESLRKHCGRMSEIDCISGSDYPYRATAPRAEVMGAMANLPHGINYNNFKDEVSKKQGAERAAVYEQVWETLKYLHLIEAMDERKRSRKKKR